MSVNKVILVGRLGKDPELTYVGANTALCKFSLATTDSYKDKSGNKQETTEWHNIVVWGKLAEVCNLYLKKGSQAYLEGKIQYRSYEKDGQTRYYTEINANEIQFLGGKGDAKKAPKHAPKQDVEQVETESYSTEDIPF